jgi:hypothetical protein
MAALGGAQQPDRVRRIGVLMAFDENDPEAKRRLSAFTQALADLGWTDGRNVRMDLRWYGGDINRMRAIARVAKAAGKVALAFWLAGRCGGSTEHHLQFVAEAFVVSQTRTKAMDGIEFATVSPGHQRAHVGASRDWRGPWRRTAADARFPDGNATGFPVRR